MSTIRGGFRGAGSSRGIRFVVALLVLAVVFGALNFLWVARSNEQDRQYVALSTDVQVRSQQLATNASEAAGGSIQAFDELQSIRDRIDNNLTLLDQGDVASGLNPTPTEARPALWDVQQIWERVRSSSDDILARTDVVRNLAAAAAGFVDNMPRLQARTEEVVQIMIRQRAPQDQVHIAGRQMLLADRMLRSIGEILQGGVTSFTAADRFATDSALYGQVLSGMINGDAELGVLKVLWEKGPATVRDVLEHLHEQGRRVAYTTVQTLLTRLEQKRYATSNKSGMAYVYRAKVSRDRVTRSRLETLLTQLYDGAAGPLVLQLIRTERLTAEEIEELQTLISELDERV